MTDAAAAARPPRAIRNITLLTGGQALYITMSSLLVTVAGLVGQMLAPDPTLATLPFALVFIANTAVTVPASFMMQRFGRRAGFMTGAALGIAGALVSAAAVQGGAFVLFCVGMMLMGASNGFNVFYRHAAVEASDESFRAKAVSIVIAGGLFAAFVGPQIARMSREAFAPIPFLGTFIALAGVATLLFIVAGLINLPRPQPQTAETPSHEAARSIKEIAATRPLFLIAVLAGLTAYATMNMLMTATPLAMTGCGLSFDNAATVIQWHVVGMFAPAFFTGHLINRFGVLNVMLLGCLLLLGAVAGALSGMELVNFFIANTLLGVGWSLLFVGATTLLAMTHRVSERGKVQAMNEFMVFGAASITAFMAGQMLARFDWAFVAGLTLPLLIATTIAVLWARSRHGARAADTV